MKTTVKYELRSKSGNPVTSGSSLEILKQYTDKQKLKHGDKAPVLSVFKIVTTEECLNENSKV